MNKRQRPAPLSEEQIAENRRQVHALLPEFLPVLKDLHEGGLFAGWREMTYAGPYRPPEPGWLNLNEILIGPFNTLEKKNGNAR